VRGGRGEVLGFWRKVGGVAGGESGWRLWEGVEEGGGVVEDSLEERGEGLDGRSAERGH
jgi:hypothetical protein